MFGKKKTVVEDEYGFTEYGANASDQTCIISSGTRIEGKFIAKENVRIDGTIIGDVTCDKKIVMGDTGYINGSVVTKESSIRGRIEGTLTVTELAHLHETAFIEGTIIAKKMIVDAGASYSGECKIGEQSVKTALSKEKAVGS